jgi:hypothetical protein
MKDFAENVDADEGHDKLLMAVLDEATEAKVVPQSSSQDGTRSTAIVSRLHSSLSMTQTRTAS